MPAKLSLGCVASRTRSLAVQRKRASDASRRVLKRHNALSLPNADCNAEARAASESDRVQQQPMCGEELIDPAEFVSTPTQRAWCAALYLSEAGLVAKASDAAPLSAAAYVVAAAILADFLSGLFHFACDNYGDKSTPVVGSVIAAFQGHHRYPWTITKREHCNNVSQTARPVAVCAVLLLVSPLHGSAAAFAAALGFCIAMSQQTHAWSHAHKSALPPLVLAAQSLGLIISAREHGAHHKKPFKGSYAIVSGVSNPLLDGGLIAALETFVFEQTGVAPRCWSEPDFAVQSEPDFAVQRVPFE